MLSNYDYLIALNKYGNRSFKDPSQYPVFPWVIQDYESEELDLEDERIYRNFKKPMGV